MDGFIGISNTVGDEIGEDMDVCWTQDDFDLELTINKELSNAKKEQLTFLPKDFKTVLSDKPGKTTFTEHDIETKEDVTPVRQRPYPVPQAKIIKNKQDVQAMLDLDVIEESNSPWSSPYSDGSQTRRETRF